MARAGRTSGSPFGGILLHNAHRNDRALIKDQERYASEAWLMTSGGVSTAAITNATTMK